jgi:hypothetical protein
MIRSKQRSQGCSSEAVSDRRGQVGWPDFGRKRPRNGQKRCELMRPIIAGHQGSRRPAKSVTHSTDRTAQRPSRMSVCGRPSNQVSNNRQRQQRTPANTDGRCFPGQTCRSAGSGRSDLASGRRGRRFKSGHPDPGQRKTDAGPARPAEPDSGGGASLPAVPFPAVP